MSDTADNPDTSYLEISTEWREGHGKALNIVRSTSAIISLIASTLVVIIIFKTKDRLTTTYHRLLLGMCVADLLASSSSAIFGVAVPSELAYLSWNASGNVASCEAQGFITTLGAIMGIWYSCTLNLYYLVKIKHNYSDDHIKRKVEPWLHGLPTSVGLAITFACLAKELINGAYSGTCAPIPHRPPHCFGVEDGVVVEGFTIPCGRGKDSVVLIYIFGIVGFLLPPIIIGTSLFLIYKSVLKQEQRIGRYGAGALNVNSAPNQSGTGSNTTTDAGIRRGVSIASIRSSIKIRFASRRSSVSEGGNSNSRAVMRRARAYALAFFITWIWFIAYMFMDVSGAWVHGLPRPSWQDIYDYFWQFFQQYQGFWTLIVFLQPKASTIKASHGVWLIRAFGIALWSGLTGKKPSPPKKKPAEKKSKQFAPPPKSSQTADTSFRNQEASQMADTSFRNQEVKADIQVVHEEEKPEIQEGEAETQVHEEEKTEVHEDLEAAAAQPTEDGVV